MWLFIDKREKARRKDLIIDKLSKENKHLKQGYHKKRQKLISVFSDFQYVNSIFNPKVPIETLPWLLLNYFFTIIFFVIICLLVVICTK